MNSALDTIEGQPHVIAVSDPFETPGALSADGTIGYAQVAYDQPASDLGVEPFEALQATLDDVRSPDLDAEIGGEYASWGTQPETQKSELIGLLAAMIILLIAFGSVVAMGLPIGDGGDRPHHGDRPRPSSWRRSRACRSSPRSCRR